MGEAALELHVERTNDHDPEGAGEHVMTGHAAAGSGLRQETIAIVAVGLTIVAVGLTILGTMLVTTSRLEARMDRAVAEIRIEARADRELFTREILRLTAGQSRVSGIFEGARTGQVR